MLSAALDVSSDTFFQDLRNREFARLDQQRHTYLDYTGSALYGVSQISAHHSSLSTTVFGNPHSEHGPSRASTAVIDNARELVLRFLDVDSSTHEVIFTANTSAAVKLVAESYPFAPNTSCLLSADNHNSVNGIREYARRAGAPVQYLALDEELRLTNAAESLMEASRRGGGLLAFPGQSNFSGVLHPLSLVEEARSLGFEVLVDIAAFAPSHAVSLRDCPADFAVLSFYKLFGYPTGLGALVGRREALSRLRRPWFAGGTVSYASVQADTHRLRSGHEGFEDGTPSFLSIAALPAGFALLEEVGMARLTEHVETRTEDFLRSIGSLRHDNGAPLVRVYGPEDMRDRGGAVAFNVCDRAGRIVPYWDVETKARDRGVAMRGGCFCNPGASEVALGLDAAEIARCLDFLGDDFTVERFATCMGRPVGAVRASFGLANNSADIHRAVEVIATFAS